MDVITKGSFCPEGTLMGSLDNIEAILTDESLEEAARVGTILEARVILCDSAHNLHVDMPAMRGIIPHEEGALGISEGTTRDIALISRVTRPVCFVVTGFDWDEFGNRRAVLSRRRAQQLCMEQYIAHLRPGDILPARVTRLENFGAFCDIGCGIPALMPIAAISVSRIKHPADRFSVGMDIRAIVQSLDEGRICLSQRELLGTWAENAAQFEIGQTVEGIIRSVESYGVFVELTPNLAGLAEFKEGLIPRQRMAVYIKNVLPERMKMKLVIIDSQNAPEEARLSVPQYFIHEGHIDHWIYSPPECDKVIESAYCQI